MKRVAWLLVLSSLAFADIPPDEDGVMPDLSCVGQAVGASCGNGGRCEKLKVRRPDFSNGGVPTWGFTDVMVCRGAKSNATLLAGVGLAALFSLLALRSRGRSSPRQTAS